MKPMEGYRILDFGRVFCVPSAALRMSDLGAVVTKVELTGYEDPYHTRQAEGTFQRIGSDSIAYCAVNRNKRIVTLDPDKPEDQKQLRTLLETADGMVSDFTAGEAAKLSLDYETVYQINPQLVYGHVSTKGAANKESGTEEDLLVQAISGICYTNGNAGQPPMPIGLPVADIYAGQFLIQGMIAGLIGRENSGSGTLVETSKLEALLDIQFEAITTFLNNGRKAPNRSTINNANAYLAAPYGIYETKDRFIAIAMIPVPKLGRLIGCEALEAFADPDEGITRRDEIKAILCAHLKTRTTAEWLSILEPADVWCADVYNWTELLATDGFQALDMLQNITLAGAHTMETLRCPIRVDGVLLKGNQN